MIDIVRKCFNEYQINFKTFLKQLENKGKIPIINIVSWYYGIDNTAISDNHKIIGIAVDNYIKWILNTYLDRIYYKIYNRIMEFPIDSEYVISGSIDLQIFDIENEILYLVDIKTSNNIYDYQKMQLDYYRLLYEDMIEELEPKRTIFGFLVVNKKIDMYFVEPFRKWENYELITIAKKYISEVLGKKEVVEND